MTTRTKKFALSVRAEAYEKLKAEAERRGRHAREARRGDGREGGEAMKRKPPSFAAVQRLRASVVANLPAPHRYYLHSRDDSQRSSVQRMISARFAAALRRRGWLHAEGYADA